MPIREIDDAINTHRARFWNWSGRRVQLDCMSFAAAEAAIAAEAGPSSIDDVQALTLGGAIGWHLTCMDRRGCIEASIDNVQGILKPLMERYGDKAMRDVGSADLLVLHAEQNERRAPAGMGGLRNAWTLLWDIAVDRGIAPRNEARIAFAAFGRHRIVAARKLPPTDLDMSAIEAGCSIPVSRLAIRLASRAGGTQAELPVLAWDDVDLNKGNVQFRFYISGGITLQQSLPDRLRTVALDPETLLLLRKWKADPTRPDTPFVLCTPDGARLQKNVLGYVLKRLQFGIEMSGVRRHAPGAQRSRKNRRYAMDLFQARYTWGDLCDYAVLQWYRQGKSEKEILALAGFSSIRSLRPYRAAFAEVAAEGEVITDIDDMLDDDGEQQ